MNTKHMLKQTNSFIANHKSLSIFMLMAVFLGGFAWATTISDVSSVFDGNVNISELNKVIYLQVNNNQDIATILNNSINTLSTRGGGTIVIPSGTFYQNSPVTINSNITIVGQGESTIIIKNGSLVKFISNTNTENVIFKSFTYKVTSTEENGIGYPFNFINKNHTNFQFLNLHIINSTQNAIRYEGGKIIIKDSIFEDVFSGLVMDPDFKSIEFEVIIQGNTFNNKWNNSVSTTDGEGVDINLHGQKGSAIITNNNFRNFTEQSIDCNIQFCLISNNYIEMNEKETAPNQAIQVSSVGNDTTAIITDNIITKVNGADSAILAVNLKSAVISGNSIQAFNITNSRGIRFANVSSHIILTNNYLSNFSICIRDETTNGNSQISDNIFYGCATNLSSANGLYTGIIENSNLSKISSTLTLKYNLGTNSISSPSMGEALMYLYSPSSSGGGTPGFSALNFDMNTGGGVRTTYGSIISHIVSNSALSTNSSMSIILRKSAGSSRGLYITNDGIQVGDGVNQRNITLTAPNSTEFSCGVNNSGSFLCS